MKHVKKRREFFEYAQIIIRSAKLINMSTFNQIFFIYDDLNLNFQRDIIKSIETITMNNFLQKLKNKKKI